MKNGPKCSRCGMPLAVEVTEGVCPRCLLALNLATETDFPVGPGGTRVAKDPPKPPPTPAELAQFFPELEVLEYLGRGGMGIVYKARQKKLNRLVALKLLSQEKMDDPKFAERFEREAQALARLNHPNIVSVYEFGEVNGLHFFIMEYVDGLSLRQLEQREQFTPEEALQIVPQICEALQFAHEAGIVHRDIKPENILLDKKGRVKIADFGIAKILGKNPSDHTLTEGKQVIGTPHYMAPEQVEKPQTVDHRADIYSLGVVFYELLTGELPLGKFAPPSRKVQVDVRLDEVVLRALEKEPARRYQHANEVKTDLETIVSTEHVPASAGATLSRWSKWKLAAAACGFVALIIVAGLSIQKARDSQSQQQPGRPLAKSGTEQKVEGAEVSTDKAGQRSYLAGFVEQPVTFSVRNLPPHKLLRITFDLYLMGSWDGSSKYFGEKIWDLNLLDGRSLLHTTFGNCGFFRDNNEQAFPDSYPCRPHPAWTGSLEHGTLGAIQSWGGKERTWDVSSVYHFSLAFPHTDSEATFNFKATMRGGKDKNYGLSKVQVDTVPELVARTEAELAALWQALGDADPDRFFKAQWDLIASGDAAAEYISRHLEENIDLPEASIQKSIQELASADTNQANRAQAVLLHQGRVAQKAVAQAADNEAFSPEVRKRLASIQKIITTYPETATELRQHRARQWLLAIYTPAAQLLASRISPEHFDSQLSISNLVVANSAAGGVGDWRRAFTNVEALLAARNNNERDWTWATAAALAAGETNAYERLCRGVLNRFGTKNDPACAERCARECLVASGLPAELLDKALERADFAVAAGPESRWRQLTKAMAEYRRGNWSNALEWLRQPERCSSLEVSTLAWGFGAMARQQLGDTNGARQALTEINRRLETMVQTGELSDQRLKFWDNFARAFVVRAEAERLILGREVSPPVNPASVMEGRTRWEPIRRLLQAGEELASQRRWQNASEAFAQAINQPGFRWDFWELQQEAPGQWLPAALLLASNETRYPELCRKLMERTNATLAPIVAEGYASLCLASPNRLPPELKQQALNLARQTGQPLASEPNASAQLLRGIMEYREGRFKEAIALLSAADSDPIIQARALAFRGMACFQLGQKAEASQALAQAEQAFVSGASAESGWWGLGLAEVALQELRALLGVQSPVVSPEPANSIGRLTYLETITSEDLRGVVDLTPSSDGQFLYSAAHLVPSINVYRRDTNSGHLKPVQVVKNSDVQGLLGGGMSVRLSPDERYAVVAAFRGQVLVFKREADTGRLELLHAAKAKDRIEGLAVPVRARFSPDGHHVYVADSQGAFLAFGFEPAAGLKWIQALKTGFGPRALAFLEEGKTMVAANSRSHALTTFARDPATGQLSPRHVLLDGERTADHIEGQLSIAASPDSRFVYVCSGRFSGDNAVSAFRVTKQGRLVGLQSFLDGDEGTAFVGGNDVIVSPDARNVYATATSSGTLLCFARHQRTGRLRLLQSFVNDGHIVADGAAGLECSPDGRFVYVSTEWQNGIAIFQRESVSSGQ